MNIYVATILSIACAITGLVFCLAPVNKFHRFSASDVGWAGSLFALLGVILMTTFKWGEVALEVSGAKLHIQQAEARIETLKNEVAQRDMAIAQIKLASDESKQLAAANDVKVKGEVLGFWTNTAKLTPEQISEALSASGFTVVPTSDINKLPSFTAEYLLPGKNGS